ncbi:MAG: Rieske 2Fe-2S domain-containing protein [Thermoleophilaceae bacterium]
MKLIRWLLALILGLRARGRPRPAPPPDPSERDLPRSRGPELVAALLLFATSLCAAAFIVFYTAHPDTQLLGLALGLAFAFLAAALILAGKRIVPQETALEERPELADGEEAAAVERLVHEGGEGVTRRRLLGLAGGAAGVTLAGALVVPAASLGPNVDDRIQRTPWRAGRRLVDTQGNPYRPEDVETGTFYTALPDHADPDELGSPLIMVKLTPQENRLPPGRRGWAPENIVAYSKICTHAGCAISLYRYPTYEPTQPRPAFVCPCHYSTFDPGRGGDVIFGPASRNLPQLPLEIDAQGFLAAKANFPDAIGPSWWDVRRTHGSGA